MYDVSFKNISTKMSKSIEQNNSNYSIGLVISYFGNSVAVEADDGQVFQCQLRRNQALPVVGDRVRWELDTNNSGIVLDIEPRRSLLCRGEAHGKTKPIAANVDTLVVVMSPPPVFSEYLIDRYLVAAELLKMEAILVLYKTDLLDAAAKAAVLERLEAYQKIPYTVVLSSIFEKNLLETLKAQLHNKLSVLVGPSGVGKSSIIAALAEEESIKIGAVSPKGAGKHTTTATRLYHLPGGGGLIDSPGVREFNLWAVTKQEALSGFKEFHAYLSGCKFRNCLHVVEPGCAVQTAVTNGKISAQRYAHYQALMKEAGAVSPYKK
jgi:ribosome biogenesis GTPase